MNITRTHMTGQTWVATDRVDGYALASAVIADCTFPGTPAWSPPT